MRPSHLVHAPLKELDEAERVAAGVGPAARPAWRADVNAGGKQRRSSRCLPPPLTSALAHKRAQPAASVRLCELRCSV